MEPSRALEIATAAERLFSARGYHATSVRQVANAVNLQGGSLYAHFASKEEMLLAIVERAAGQFHAALEPALAAGGSVVERLRGAISAHVGVITASPEAATVYFQDWRHLTGDALHSVHLRRDAYEALWRELIAEGVAGGELAPVDPRLGAIACLSLCNWTYQWFDPIGPLDGAAIADFIADVALLGLAATPTTSSKDEDRPC